MFRDTALRVRSSLSNQNDAGDDDCEYPERCEFWQFEIRKPPKNHRIKKRDQKPIILSGHGVALRVDRGTLFIRNGFTHYPQSREEYRFFPGDLNLPTRIILVDCSGSISLDVLAWLSQQAIPLIQLNWRGDVNTVFSGNGYCAKPKLVEKQLTHLKTGDALKIARNLVREKLENSLHTILKYAHDAKVSEMALSELKPGIRMLKGLGAISLDKMRGIEGRAAALYFRSFAGTPIRWSSDTRKPIPIDWRRIGSRLSPLTGSNRNARHPVNAMLNYAYAIAQAQIKIRIITEGRDPTIGLMHHRAIKRDNLVLDLLEPLRPVVDRVVLEMVREHTFSPGDFTITPQGVCRLNPEMARQVTQRTIRMLDQTKSGYLPPMQPPIQ